MIVLGTVQNWNFGPPAANQPGSDESFMRFLFPLKPVGTFSAEEKVVECAFPSLSHISAFKWIQTGAL